MPQVDDVFDTLRVRENLAMGGYLLSKRTRNERVEQVLGVFPALRSKLHRFVGSMTGGERKMTALARALMLAPRVLVLDEPTAGLSPALTSPALTSVALTSVVLTEQIRVLADHGHAMLLVEQKPHAALQMADWAYVMLRGQVAKSAPAADVLADPAMGELFPGGPVAEPDGSEVGS